MVNNDILFFDNIFNNQSNKNILLLGDTNNYEKFAYKILKLLETKDFNIYCVDKQYAEISDITINFDIVVLCMHPIKAFGLLKDHVHKLKNVIIQPGAESDDIINLLKSANINYTLGCVLKYFKAN